MQRLIESNIGTLFPGLKFLESEFREMSGGEHRPDTIAFDMNRNTFVAIEHKNGPSEGAVDQARTYLGDMKRYRGELVLSHSKNMKCSPRDKQSFNWNEMYAIIIAPEFTKYQVSGANEDPNVELHEITVYNENVILMEHVSGNRLVTSSGYVDTSSNTGAHDMDQLYGIIRSRLLVEFPGAEVNEKPKQYDGFRLPGSREYFCVINVQKQKIWLEYSGKRAKQELRPSEFVSATNWSEIKDEADFKRALDILKWLHGNGEKPAEQA